MGRRSQSDAEGTHIVEMPGHCAAVTLLGPGSTLHAVFVAVTRPAAVGTVSVGTVMLDVALIAAQQAG